MPNSSSHSALRDLITRVATQGRVDAIVIRPERGQAAILVESAQAEPGLGLIGDRRARQRRTDRSARKRELTMIQAEHLPLIGQWSRRPGNESSSPSSISTALDPTRLRRNLVVSGVNLLAMKSPFADVQLQWQIGASLYIEVTGPCDPCSKMEAELGAGGYNAMRGHGGVTARIITGGVVHVGDAVVLKAVVRPS